MEQEGGGWRRGIMPGQQYVYAGFWRRLGAFLIDLALIWLFIALQYFLLGNSRLHDVVTGIFVGFAVEGYFLYCHGRWGQTVGKRVTGIRVVTLKFEPISWKQAFLRSSVAIVFIAVLAPVYLNTVFQMPGAFYAGARDSLEFTKHLPSWYGYITDGKIIWDWSEFVVMMTNNQRRALHDFIAGTAVVRRSSAKDRDKDDPFLKDWSKDMSKMKDPMKV